MAEPRCLGGFVNSDTCKCFCNFSNLVRGSGSMSVQNQDIEKSGESGKLTVKPSVLTHAPYAPFIAFATVS